MSAALKLVPENDPQAKATAAQTEADRLAKAARHGEHKSQLAKLAFEDAPSADTHAKFAIADQLAKNARRDADAYNAEVASLLQQASRERDGAELIAVLERVNSDAAITKQRERIADIVIELRRQMRGAILDLDAALHAHNAQRARATQLSQRVGRAEDYRSLGREQVLAQLNESFRGPQGDYEVASTNLGVFNPTGDARQERFTLQVTDLLGAR